MIAMPTLTRPILRPLNRVKTAKAVPRLIAIDTETTGLDLWHGCRPFMVTSCDDAGTIRVWEWPVDPFTREVTPDENDVEEISKLLEDYDEIGFFNAKYDLRGLAFSGVRLPNWSKIHDASISAHIVSSSGARDLKTLSLQYLDILDDDEKSLQKACVSGRATAKKLGWRIAAPYDPHWPATKRAGKSNSFWKADLWIPAALARLKEGKQEWLKVCQTYGVRDAERTLGLVLYFQKIVEEMGGQDHYRIRMESLQATFEMENNGITFQRDEHFGRVEQKHITLGKEAERICFKMVDRKIDNLASSQQLQNAFYSILKMPVVRQTPSGQPSTDKDTIKLLEEQIRPQSKAGWFLEYLKEYRKRQNTSNVMNVFRRGAFQVQAGDSWFRLHPSFHVTGTDTTRLSSSNPNGQNISEAKGFDSHEGYNLRELFGPLPGFYWLSHDFSNIEMRIFAYQAGEEEWIQAFEEDRAVHLIVCELLYPAEYAECQRKGLAFKDTYKDLYQWVKNGNFSLIYGAGQYKADMTYHVKGAYNKIRRRFKQIDRFMVEKHNEARDQGFVTLLGGYRLEVPADGPHKAVNYFVQGSAGWAMAIAMNRVADYFRRSGRGKLIMTIHDELISNIHSQEDHNVIAPKISSLMSSAGDDIGLKLPVEARLITKNWADEKPLKLAV